VFHMSLARSATQDAYVVSSNSFGTADGARPLQKIGFKVELIERSVERQLAIVVGLS
jgi:hypothetical protein